MPLPAAILYASFWSAFSVVALGLAVRRRRALVLCRREYWATLARPWSLLSFAAALAGFVVLAPYSGDRTWDWIDAGFMGVLTFATGPFSLGVMVRCLRGQEERWQLWPASACWLLSASWLYDAYLWWRDGIYPLTWWSNLIASSFLFFAGGAFWSLTVRPGRGLTFAFLERQWLDPHEDRVTPGLIVALLLGALLIGGLMTPFLLEAWARIG